MSDREPGEWLELVVPVREAGAADEIAGLLVAALPDAGSGVELRDLADPGPGQAAHEVVFWVPVDRGEAALDAARREVARLGGGGLPVDAAGVALRPAVPEAEWRDAWKRYFRTTRLTRQIVVVPSWDEHQPTAGDHVLHLDPGQAFGTGAHASTRLVLTLMQALADGEAGAPAAAAAPARVLDLGTGSGILALAAAALWPAADVLAADNDPIAVDTARENIEGNPALAGRIRVAVTPVDGREQPFALILANIQADVLISLAPTVAAQVAPGGHLILSGLLAEQVDGVARIYEQQPAGLRRVEIRPSDTDPAWAAALLRRAE